MHRLDRRAAMMIAVGGALGATVRWALVTAAGTGAVPWWVLGVNVVGSLVLGATLTRATRSAASVWRDGVGVGFCGGLTTFSTFAVEIVEFARDEQAAAAAAYAVASVASAIAAVAAGRALGGARSRAARMEHRR